MCEALVESGVVPKLVAKAGSSGHRRARAAAAEFLSGARASHKHTD